MAVDSLKQIIIFKKATLGDAQKVLPDGQETAGFYLWVLCDPFSQEGGKGQPEKGHMSFSINHDIFYAIHGYLSDNCRSGTLTDTDSRLNLADIGQDRSSRNRCVYPVGANLAHAYLKPSIHRIFRFE